jgi:transposase
MNRQNMAKWCHEFEAGGSDVHDELRSGRPSIVTDEIIQKINENIHADRRLIISGLHQQCPAVSRTVLHEIVTKRLGYWKLCVHWVLKMLTDDHKKNRMAAA